MDRLRPYAGTIQRLRDAQLRPTRQRLALCRLLFDGDNRHVTAESLHTEALNSGVRIALATVYNALHQFTDAGMLREVVVEPSKSYFDTNTTLHHHFYHETTGVLEDIAGEAISLERLPEAPPGCTVSRVDIVIRLQEAAATS
jgi:Fur family iron response transcriptional regulator